jgi:hypothetical protein
MSEPREGRLDLLRAGRQGSEGRPASDDPDRTLNPLSGSRHSRIAPPLPATVAAAGGQVGESAPPEPGAAEAFCADLARHALGELAVALPLLGHAGRRRARALTAWSYTLFDFARQPGLEGERLAAINRWEFATEEALEDQPSGEPIFVLLAAEHRREPWPREALDALVALARRRVSTGRAQGDPVDRRARPLAAALVSALLAESGHGPPQEAVTIGTALLVQSGSCASSAAAAEHRMLPEALRRELRDLSLPASLPRPQRRALRFLAGAVRYWLQAGGRTTSGLPLTVRVRLLLASWLG